MREEADAASHSVNEWMVAVHGMQKGNPILCLIPPLDSGEPLLSF
jgi:hypothetical protein